MRRVVLLTLAILSALPNLAGAQSEPPHAWLFGTWTGGLFPVPSRISSEACFAQPVVIFTHDLVLRATLTDQTLTQRVIETARATSSGTEFHLAAAPAAQNMFGVPSSTAGFGCSSPDSLNVQRRGENEISFPGCSDFPYPLVRCH